jgi:GTPase SAR1 family protein
VSNNRQHLLGALKKGTKKWGRSKIMIVGDGRAGKTALANSIMGEEFVHTESTIGINQMTCDVKFAEVGKEGQWDEYTKPDKELEAALAKIVAARRQNGGDDADAAQDPVMDEDEEDAEDSYAGAGGNGGVGADSAHASGAASRPAGTAAGGQSKKKKSNKARAASGPDADADEAPAGASLALAIDDALVMKYLANLNDNTKFVISLFDYGGQSVFNVIHHLFLTRYGVYTLVFNMEQLVSPDPAVRENCLSTISFWLNSIVVHTWHAESETMAPIVIVGTHKDIVKSASDHAQISKILHDKFCSSVAWPFIVENEDGDDGISLCFFPVDNRRSRKDTTVQKMMKLIEDVIDRSEYVHAERPLTWLQTMDRLTACGKAFLPLSEVEAIAGECDVPRDAVPSLLSFLHEMGILMWHDDIALRDVVILDAVAYFVTPVTTIICKHLATAADATRHVVEAHKKCSKLYYDAWMKMVHHGVVNTDIIGTLLQDCGQQASVVVHLMVKFGLVVPLQIAKQLYGHHAQGTKAKATEYLVPALLPPLKEAAAVEQDAVARSEEYANTCYFVFSCSNALAESSMLTVRDAENHGFLPRGLFERLICKAVEWCRDTSAVQSLQSQPLFQDAAVLAFGNQRFRMRAFHAQNCIQVDFARGNPLAVHQRLSEQLQQIMDECMKSLRFFTVLPYPVANAVEALSGADTATQQLIQLEYLRDIAKKHTGLHGVNGSKLLNKTQLAEHYGDWLVDDALRAEYDVFISYRWGTLDSRFTERLRDRFSTYNVGEDSRAVTVFLDNKRLRDGRNFVDDFARALVHSLIVVPVLTSDALQRMKDHNPQQKDNVLLEWVMALECFHSSSSRVTRVLPLLFGKRDSNTGAIGDLYREGILDQLPDVKPEETLRTAVRLLRANGVEPRPEITTYTVRGILDQLRVILGYCTWTAPDPAMVVAESAEKVVGSLQEVLEEAPKVRPVGGMKSGPSAESGDMRARGPCAGDCSEPLTASPPKHPRPVDGEAGTPTKRTAKVVVDDIRLQLGLASDLPMAQVLEEALRTLADAGLAEECKLLGLVAKAEKILAAIVG